ncbi:MAG TPA: DNA repair protein RecN [Lachnospiraceae bacterium]|nr:DNA repair protein RecN [Lachnospiraceae bacterium]
MLVNLHVKNLALIEEAEIDFRKGLNILTGETGAGKSILIDSVHFALGGKLHKDVVRDDADYALAELIFVPENDKQLQAIRDLDIPVEDEVVMQRKIVNGRSISKVNGETVTTNVLQALADILIDIHGQNEHQSLLKKRKHMQVLDAFCGEELTATLQQTKSLYEQYTELQKELTHADIDVSTREKEIALASFEIEEIENAAPKQGEDEELEQLYRRMVNSKKIVEALNDVHLNTGYDSERGAGDGIGRALRELRSVSGYDESLESMLSQLSEIDDLLNDFNRTLSDYLAKLEFGEEDFHKTEERLNLLNHLKNKYGDSIERILEYHDKQQKKLEQLMDYDAYLKQLREQTEQAKNDLTASCRKVSEVRSQKSILLSELMQQALRDLNFLEARFEIEVRQIPDYFSVSGFDEVEFMISTNPGERVKPLTQVASGGEMSRIMLAIKAVLANKDEIGTLIFDEIDAGISGRTAQKVSEKLALLSKTHQVICVTHLPQIAAMADAHFEIMKEAKAEHTLTKVHELNGAEINTELARMLGGAEITPVVLQNATEMKELATNTKKKLFEI